MTMKGGRDKAMKPEQGKQKNETAARRPALVCNSACNIPGVGTWAHGEIVRDPELMTKISGSPNFDKIEEVE